MTERKRRSERLTQQEHEALQTYVQTFPTKTDAAEVIGVSRQVLDGVVLKGSGRYDTVRLIRSKLKQLARKDSKTSATTAIP